MSCPALVTWTPGSTFVWEDCTAYFLTDSKRYVGRFSHNVFGVEMKKWSSQEERFDNLANAFSDLMEPGDRVVLEGYAMGAKGMVFHIGENTGILKNRLWQKGLTYDAVSPSVIKKHATGKGNADKAAMNEAFVAKTGFDISLGLVGVMSLWLGNRMQVAPHFDLPDNIACVVAVTPGEVRARADAALRRRSRRCL